MDFKKTLKILISEFEKNDIHYALTGGFALGALGVVRATLDMDFLVDFKDIKKLKRIMTELGYNPEFETENVSQYVSSIDIFGEVDFIHANKPLSLKMIENAIEKEVFDKSIKIRVLRPEDIIALKLQAIKNDAEREHKDMFDIESLLEEYGKTISWDLLKSYFELFELQDKFAKLKNKYEKRFLQ
jgi:predicted nucleotidyltransferase